MTYMVKLEIIEVKDYIEKEKYIVIDYFVLDIVNKELFLYDNRLKDSFIDDIDIKKIGIKRYKDKKIITIIPNNGIDIIIEINLKNQIIGYKNNNIVSVKDNFLCDNTTINEIIMNNLKIAGNYFLEKNKCLKKINFKS